MSFSGMVKEELSRHIGSGRHCRIAELAAIFTFCGSLEAGTCLLYTSPSPRDR